MVRPTLICLYLRTSADFCDQPIEYVIRNGSGAVGYEGSDSLDALLAIYLRDLLLVAISLGDQSKLVARMISSAQGGLLEGEIADYVREPDGQPRFTCPNPLLAP